MTVNQIFKGTPEAEIVDTTHALIVKLSEYIKYTKSEKENSMEQYLLYIAKKELTIIISKHINWNLLPQDTPVYVYPDTFALSAKEAIAKLRYYRGYMGRANGSISTYTEGVTSHSSVRHSETMDINIKRVLPAEIFEDIIKEDFLEREYSFLTLNPKN